MEVQSSSWWLTGLDWAVDSRQGHLMGISQEAPGRKVILSVAALIFLWGLFGLVDSRNIPYGGFQWNHPDHVVLVEEGGPADQAGMHVGDRIIVREGIPVRDSRTLARQPRAKVGEARTFVVERTSAVTGQSVTDTLSIAFAAEPGPDVARRVIGAGIGLVFLLCGILAYFRVPSLMSLLFCVVGLCFGAVMLPAPYLSTFRLRASMELIGILVALTGLASLLHFLLVFPKRKKMLEQRGREKLVYVPAALVGLMATLSIILGPDNEGRWIVVGFFLVFLVLGYLVASVLAIIHTFLKARSEERSRFGLNFILWSIMIGLVPVALNVVLGNIAPRVSVPAADFFLVTIILIPVAFARALVKSGPVPG